MIRKTIQAKPKAPEIDNLSAPLACSIGKEPEEYEELEPESDPEEEPESDSLPDPEPEPPDPVPVLPEPEFT